MNFSNVNDSAIFATRRHNMVQELAHLGIKSEKVLEAMRMVPRHFFVDETLRIYAYENRALRIGCDQTISHPYTVAYQTELLDIKRTDKILEIGTGSGYQTAILSLLGQNIYSIERQKGLYLLSQKRLSSICADNVVTLFADGNEGYPDAAPFDKILQTAGAEDISPNLLKQLSIGGTMVAPLGKKTLWIYRIQRLSENKFRKEKFIRCAFVPMLSGTEDSSL